MRISDWSSDVCSSESSVNANAPATFGSESSSKKEVVAFATPARKPTRLVQGQVYSYIKDGVRHYTSKRPKGVEGAPALRTIRYSFTQPCFACASSPAVNFNPLRLNTSAYSDALSNATSAETTSDLQ